MSSTSAPETLSDLQTDLINRVRQATGVTATNTQATRYLNIALEDMHVGFTEKLPWCHRRATLITHPQYTTGTVTITQGSTTLTGTSTVWTTTNAFGVANARTSGKITIAGTPEVYTIASVGGAGTITLGSRYVGSDVTAGTYSYFEDEYDLASDFLRPLHQQFFDQNAAIAIMGRREFLMRYPRNSTVGTIRACSIVDLAPSGNTTPIRRIVFAPPPQEAELIQYDYITSNLAVSSAGAAQKSLSASTDEPIVPKSYRIAIVYHALYNWYRDQKDDVRAVEAKQEYTDFMLRMTSDHQIGRSTPQLRPRMGMYTRSAKKPYSRGGRRHQLGTAFDEMRG